MVIGLCAPAPALSQKLERTSHGELLQLGFSVSEPTVSRYLQRIRRRYDEGQAKQRLAFLNNHREVIAAFDFFTVATLNFRTVALENSIGAS